MTKKKYYVPVERIDGHTKMFGRHPSEASRKNMSRGQKRRYKRKEERDKLSQHFIAYWSDEEKRRKHGEIVGAITRKRLSDPANIEERRLLKIAFRKKQLIINEEKRKFRADHRQETIDRLRKSRIRAVHQYTMDGEYVQSFESGQDALEYFNRNKNGCSISNCMHGRSVSAYGFKWSHRKTKTYKPIPIIKRSKV